MSRTFLKMNGLGNDFVVIETATQPFDPSAEDIRAIAKRGDGGIGCVALLALPTGGFEVAKMTVSEVARGQGLGKLLMQACIDKATKLGARRLYLETNSSLAPALALYRALGFVALPAGDTPHARCDVRMERPI